jgi:hypothetical protein
MYNQPLIIDILRTKIMGWAGHVARAEEDSVIKKALNLEYDKARKKGRPKKRWIDGVRSKKMVQPKK